MATERVVTGKKYRILSSVSDKVWDVISFFTKSSDVWNNNDKNLQTTVGSITGISSSLTSTSSTVAASAAAVKALNDKIVELEDNLMSSDSITKELSDITSTTLKNNGSYTATFDGVAIVSIFSNVGVPTGYTRTSTAKLTDKTDNTTIATLTNNYTNSSEETAQEAKIMNKVFKLTNGHSYTFTMSNGGTGGVTSPYLCCLSVKEC